MAARGAQPDGSSAARDGPSAGSLGAAERRAKPPCAGARPGTPREAASAEQTSAGGPLPDASPRASRPSLAAPLPTPAPTPAPPPPSPPTTSPPCTAPARSNALGSSATADTPQPRSPREGRVADEGAPSRKPAERAVAGAPSWAVPALPEPRQRGASAGGAREPGGPSGPPGPRPPPRSVMRDRSKPGASPSATDDALARPRPEPAGERAAPPGGRPAPTDGSARGSRVQTERVGQRETRQGARPRGVRRAPRRPKRTFVE